MNIYAAPNTAKNTDSPEDRQSTWARLFSPFKLVYRGSTSSELLSRAYGRLLFLYRLHWFWILGLINHQRIFEIDSSFKFVVLLLEKGGQADPQHVPLKRPRLADLEQSNLLLVDILRFMCFSTKLLAVVEALTQGDFTILEKLYQHAALLHEQDVRSWQLRDSTQFQGPTIKALSSITCLGSTDIVLMAMGTWLMTANPSMPCAIGV